ncbi:putative selenium delivery protein YdfZ [Sodalis ligni]|jgi:putative selenium-binding protein YdfZ|uniref:Putative selenium-binding protein YdfZ n=1 Tax=Sodalis ligni TaxID=2697027 RepID=A0A4R1N9X6_9GAMM|nr:putative selenium delivery protein YdfZ [Sodalis ligni]QWA12395.1 putative selenium delivery protein YdfZ [Sodalis ligni]TCL04185.1 putative selenium-binding protein YdfZ [Sodalis ligni]
MIHVYDRNRNAIIPGQKVMIAATGETSIAKAVHAEGLSPVEAERAKCVELQNTAERYIPFELIRLA